MKPVASPVLCILALSLCTAESKQVGRVFLVLMTDKEDSGESGPYVLEDNQCLDPPPPREPSSCRVQVLAPNSSVYSDSRITEMFLDFQHPSRPNAECQVRLPSRDGVVTRCKEGKSKQRGGGGRSPGSRGEMTPRGEISFHELSANGRSCGYTVYDTRYHRDGLQDLPERRPTVVFLTTMERCIPGVTTVSPLRYFRPTETLCVYNNRRRCRPQRKKNQ